MLNTPTRNRLRPLRHGLLGAAAVAGLSLGAAAHADSVSLLGNAGLVDSLDFDLGNGLTMTLTGTTFRQKAYQTAQVGQTDDGIGITHSFNNDAFFIDGKGGDDTLWMTFSEDVTIAGFEFNFTNDASDDAKLLDADDNTLLRFDVEDSVTFDDTYTGSSFGLKAFGTRDDWTLTSILFAEGTLPVETPSNSLVDAPVVTAVPTPSAALAGAFTLGALALRRRRRQSTED